MKKSRTLELDNKDSIRDIPANGSDVSKKPEFIVPPGLSEYIYLFEAHYDSAGKMPIIVVGDTGVGKRLFLHLFEKLYMEKEKSAKVIYVNCANLGGGDPNLAKSELFGAVKGSHSRAEKDTFGFLKVADGGALILDEIGELPLDTQAKLLTFIETGKYQMLGDTAEITASIRIIAATNNLAKLGDAFRERFYIFYVPPLQQRRRDVLYYLWWLHPETIKELMHWEVLALLAHNWPGNVREIDKVGRFLKREKLLFSLHFREDANPDLLSGLNDQRIGTKLMHLDKSETSFDPNPTLFLYQNIKKAGIDVKALESVLKWGDTGGGRSRGKGLVSKNLAFPKVSEFNMASYKTEQESNRALKLLRKDASRFNGFDTLKRFDVVIVENFQFDQAYQRYARFCHLFFQDIAGNQNGVLVNECTSTEGNHGHMFIPHHLPEFEKLKRSIFHFLTGIEIPSGREIPDDIESREAFCLDLLKEDPSNSFLAPLKERYPIKEKEEQVNIWSMKYDEFLRYYYEGLIERTGGNKREAANRIGVNYQTFNSRYRSLFNEEGNSNKQAEHQSSRRRRRVHP